MRAEVLRGSNPAVGPAPAPPVAFQAPPEAPPPTRSFRGPDGDDRLIRRLLSDELHEHLEEVAGTRARQEPRDLQARLDRQQGAYKRSTFLKRRLMMDMRKANHRFTSQLRDYRQAMADLTHCRGTEEHARSLGRLVIAGQALAGMAQQMLGLMGHMRDLDQDVNRAGELVPKAELEGRSFDEIRSSSSESALELGHWEHEWCTQSVRDGLDLLNGGLDQAVKDMTTPAGADSRIAVASLVAQQARLRELLGKLR